MKFNKKKKIAQTVCAYIHEYINPNEIRCQLHRWVMKTIEDGENLYPKGASLKFETPDDGEYIMYLHFDNEYGRYIIRIHMKEYEELIRVNIKSYFLLYVSINIGHELTVLDRYNNIVESLKDLIREIQHNNEE